MTDRGILLSERIDRAQAFAAALNLVGPILDTMGNVYVERIKQISTSEPWEAQKITNLAIASSIAEQVKKALESGASDEALAREELARTRQIERLTPERRRAIGMAILGD